MQATLLKRRSFWLTFLFVVGCLAVYWLTAYRTMTWWNGSSYSASALCLGIGTPPGSLMLTIIGWLVTRLPLGVDKLFLLNLFGGVIAAVTIAMIMFLARGLVDDIFDRRTFQGNRKPSALLLFTVGLVVLTMAFGKTMWSHAVIFQPYVLTTLLTTLILWSMLSWWRDAKDPGAWKWHFLTMLLFGLDFSIHRTNLILLPGVLVWILLRYPGAFTRWRIWLGGMAGLALGLAFHLLLIPIARAQPPLNANDPSNWSRFYDYISLKQYGGGWLVNLYPRKAPFVDVQLKLYIDYFADNFAYMKDSFGVMLVLPVLLAVAGLILMAVRRWRLTLGLFVFFLLTSLGEVFYFNTPEGFFWPMDRHYLSSFMFFTLFGAYGAGRIALYLRDHPGFWRVPAVSALIIILAAAPAIQLKRNYQRVNGAEKTFAHDYAMNVFNTIEDDAVLFIMGDNYWPFLCLQLAHDVRPDVTLISTSLTNTSWYLRQMKRQHPLLPVKISDDEIDQLSIPKWQDTTISVEVLASSETYRVEDSYEFPDSVQLNVPPTIANSHLMIQDWFLLNLLENNRFRRPVYFNAPPGWLRPLCRPEGIVWCAVPSESLASGLNVLKENLRDKYSYAGFDDASVSIDQFARYTASELRMAFLTLAWEQSAQSDTAACETIRAMERVLPPDRVPYAERFGPTVEQLKEASGCE